MGIMIKNVKLGKDGKYRFRRKWPDDVRAAFAELPRELKQTFSSGLTQQQAAIKAAELNSIFDERVNSVRSGRLEQMTEEQAHAAVAEWYARERNNLSQVAVSFMAEGTSLGAIEVEETVADFELDAIIEEASKQFGVDEFGHPKQLTAEQKFKIEVLNKGKMPQLKMTISRAIDYYVEHQRSGVATQSEKSAKDQAIEFFEDVPITDLTRLDANRWAQHLASVRGQSGSTVSKRIGTLKATFNVLLDHGMIEGDNPFARLKVPKAAKKPIGRKPFLTSHLRAIERYLETSRVSEETVDVIHLLMFTGCRPGEIAGLRVQDVVLSGPIPYVYVRWTENVRLKNEQSTRRVPLVGGALEAAKRSVERVGEGFLFPILAPREGSERKNNNLSARVNKCIRAAGILKTEALVTYSFRHTMAAALDLTETVNEFTRERFLGHAKKDDYGSSELPLDRALAALEAALPNLGNVDAIEYTEEELRIG
ncbi:tyrosine-type recombinase/integrase [Ponticaulis sp.]|uniref:site-specific integrase n=1 Tax=Ponticaulis sp. TaxID=2020902 RepID=UPI000C5CB3C1|nr:tyrosine-type recombinase/integrase [Ponticaulis sp.]MAJ10561.1 hypothetical protein [Ponticaulis sp.]HBH89768.1 hypothetical protein [Hyphomonadaceae bacterium]|tara:strand:- start:1837 stop:3279 length:1443 start_codon:yes stop_codon:yes gene_type:complete